MEFVKNQPRLSPTSSRALYDSITARANTTKSTEVEEAIPSATGGSIFERGILLLCRNS